MFWLGLTIGFPLGAVAAVYVIYKFIDNAADF